MQGFRGVFAGGDAGEAAFLEHVRQVALGSPTRGAVVQGRGKGKDKGAGSGGGAGTPRPGPGPGGLRPHGGRLHAALGLLALMGFGGAGSELRAQTPDLLVSLSADDTAGGVSVRDQDVLFHAPGTLARVQCPSETLSLLAGDHGNALHPVFTDVDALHDRGVLGTAGHGLLFSVTVDEAGFLDGDIIGVGSSGALEIFLPESAFVNAVGAADGTVDIDAFHMDADGTLLFSFADNEGSFLSGDDPNVLKDGDILIWNPAAGPDAAVLFTENQVNALVGTALGVATSTVDTLGLARHPVTGDVLFSVQSPTAQDATVFSTAGGGSVLAGHAEADFGFGGSPELDALAVAVAHYPGSTTSVGKPAPGSTIVLSLTGATPGMPYLALVALDHEPPAFALQGWGGFVLAQDVLLGAALASAPSLLLVPDALGHASLTALLPLAIGPTDVVVQLVAPAPGPVGSNPLLLELAQ